MWVIFLFLVVLGGGCIFPFIRWRIRGWGKRGGDLKEINVSASHGEDGGNFKIMGKGEF
jgi:hypothetical protein